MFALLKELVWWAGILLPLWFQTVVEKEEKKEDLGKKAKEARVRAPPSRESPCAVGTHSITHQQASVLLVPLLQCKSAKVPNSLTRETHYSSWFKRQHPMRKNRKCWNLQQRLLLSAWWTQTSGFAHPQKAWSCQVKGSGLWRVSEASHRLSFLFPFFSPLVRGLPPSQEEQCSAQRHLSLSRWTLVLETCSSAKAGEKGGRGPDQSRLWSEYNFWNVAKSVTHSSAGNWLWKQLCSCSPGLPISLTWWQRCRVEQWGRGRLLTLTDLI